MVIDYFSLFTCHDVVIEGHTHSTSLQSWTYNIRITFYNLLRLVGNSCDINRFWQWNSFLEISNRKQIMFKFFEWYTFYKELLQSRWYIFNCMAYFSFYTIYKMSNHVIDVSRYGKYSNFVIYPWTKYDICCFFYVRYLMHCNQKNPVV